ncbi:MAG: MBL fold metallo-hydrolase, partial [Pseudomonadota bacterium]
FPLDQPFGYRCSANGRVVVFSGDTCPDDRVIAAARGADVLIHECVEFDKWRMAGIDTGHMAHALTDAPDFGRVADAAKVGHAVTTHMLAASEPRDLAARIRATYAGALTIGADLMTV